MRNFDEAINDLKAGQLDLETESIPLKNCLGRILLDEIVASVEQPPFAKSAMDGYAVQSADSSDSYKIVETIAAGQVPSVELHRGQCSSIMTGAMMPPNADAVIRKEYVTVADGRMFIDMQEPTSNVILQGENLKLGDPVLSPRILRPQDIGILAEQGRDRIDVAIAPKIGIITTGSELRNPGERLDKGQIYNSNGPQLVGQILAVGANPVDYGIAEDSPDVLKNVVRQALSESHILLLTGGVSMGDFDFVPSILEEIGVETVFHHLAVKPGKPTLYGRTQDNKHVFGLPGNPVSTFVIFELIVKPVFFQLVGIPHESLINRGILTDSIVRRKSDRIEYRPVVHRAGRVSPIPYHGSSHLHAFSAANGLLRIEKDVELIEKGEVVDVRQI